MADLCELSGPAGVLLLSSFCRSVNTLCLFGRSFPVVSNVPGCL